MFEKFKNSYTLGLKSIELVDRTKESGRVFPRIPHELKRVLIGIKEK